MTPPLDDRYFEWLYGQIAAVRNRNPSRSFWTLSRQLYTKEFVWIVPNDDNRVEDGKELRYEFISEKGIDQVDPEWMELGCSMLEMLIAFARRASFASDEATIEWFWRFIVNLGLYEYNDRVYTSATSKIVDETLDAVIFRTYEPNGVGGLFPLTHPTRDQRTVELWYQLAAFLLETV